MTIEKLNLQVNPRERARAADFNRVTAKVDEIIDSLGSVYYGVCENSAQAKWKTVTLTNFVSATDGKPKDGTMLVVRFAKGNTASEAHMNVNGTSGPIPLYWGIEPVPADAIAEGATVSMVYDSEQGRLNIISGVTVNLPAKYISEYNLKLLMAGAYSSDSALVSGIYATLVGDERTKEYEGCQLLMPWGTSFIAVNLVEDEREYTFEFVCNARHYAFCLFRKGDGSHGLEIVDSGTSITTVWED